MNKLSSSDLIVVFKGNSVDAEIVKEILSDNGILVSLKKSIDGLCCTMACVSGGDLNP